MKTFSTEAIVRPENKIVLDHLPFGEGETLFIYMLATAKSQRDEITQPSLRGSVLSYEAPFESVSFGKWEAAA